MPGDASSEQAEPLFGFSADIAREAIRHSDPEADEAEVERLLRERLAAASAPYAAKRREEQQLLTALRSRRGEFKSLLEECSSQRGYEDPIYRFYHQSFKVYGLQ